MNQYLQRILSLIQQSDNITAEQKSCIAETLSAADREWGKVTFKLEDAEKVKRTTAIRLEETIEELEEKRKAVEAQNRELEIEAALERVRSRSMQMHYSDELDNVVKTLGEELVDLGISLDGALIFFFEKDKRSFHLRVATNQLPEPLKVNMPYEEDIQANEIVRDLWQAIETGGDYINKSYSGKVKDDYFRFVGKHNASKIPEDVRKLELDAESWTFSFTAGKNAVVGVDSWSGKVITPDEFDVLKRFARVFEQAYTRFLDLQKAEAQAREAEIQLALERVRAKTLAMQKQDDLLAVLDVLTEQLIKLGVQLDIANFSNGLPEGDWNLWIRVVTAEGKMYSDYVHFPQIDHPYFNSIKQAVNIYKAGGTNLSKEVFSKEEKDSWQRYLTTQTIFRNTVFEEDNRYVFEKPGYTWSAILLKDTWVSICRFNTTPFTNEEDNLLKRFADAFGLAYTRFLDLQKAEAQAKEAQIEVALEKVRSRSLAVHKSDEFNEVIKVVFERLQELKIPMTSVSINVIIEGSKDTEAYICGSGEDGLTLSHIRLIYFDHPITNDRYNAYEKGLDFFSKTYSKEDKNSFYEYEFEASDLKYIPSDIKKTVMESECYTSSVAFTKNSMIVVNDFEGKLLSSKEIDIVKRFARVFEQAYTRFLDLKKSEAQAKEATVEAALERVRGRAISMHNSNDLSSAASMVFTELRRLGISPIRCGVGLLNKESRKALLYSAASSPDGDSLALIGWVILSGHPVLEKIYETWVSNEDYFPELNGEQLKSYYELLLAGLSVSVPDWQSGQKQYGHFFNFSVGCLYAWSQVRYNDEEIKILKRFASVIDLTFRRYMELQKAEANAREAVKQAALDRIRAEIASMRTISDLDRITPLIWNELNIIGIPFIRCGVFIMDDAQKLIHTFLSTPEGKAIAAVHIPYTAPGNIAHVLNHWYDKKNYVDHWSEDDFTEFARMLVEQAGLNSSKEYLKTVPHGGFYLHFLPFLQGMLYVGNTAQLKEDEMKLIQSVADAFSTAYARYEDFNNLEAAKNQVDKTLVELKQTQQQLVQAEKMASLGELTAGIAHEIQNPLNFVNNFSEVNKELIDEMQDALQQDDKEEAVAIALDIKDNLQKIHHHGKRADAIVKGMLQHSRASTGKKELTDINALADEYLRLSYHGLRAKDKDFNANFKTDFDESVGKIEVVPQDVGRVLLNLYNNAFYSVHEKKKQLDRTFEPTVEVRTKRVGDKVEIHVKDNGTGIPQKVVDKIYQPFFTTKPTGQGTGLGLSLSYDIIKAHGGEIEVETKEGEGASFVIILPFATSIPHKSSAI
jgi:signal transduction histidine kinase